MASENDQDLSLPSISGMSADSTHTDSLSNDIGSSTLGGLVLQQTQSTTGRKRVTTAKTT